MGLAFLKTLKEKKRSNSVSLFSGEAPDKRQGAEGDDVLLLSARSSRSSRSSRSMKTMKRIKSRSEHFRPISSRQEEEVIKDHPEKKSH